MRVLILDDEVQFSHFVGRIAESLGFSVAAASTADEFRASYLVQLPDLVVLDLQLGQHDGFEQLRFLSDRGYPNALVLVSGFDDRVLNSAARLAQRLGLSVEGALPKPIRAEALRTELRRIGEALGALTSERLIAGLSAGELTLEYQPIVNLTDRSVRTVEALIRWDHPATGRIAPERFLPMAEKSQPTIDALTDWVLARACSDHQSFRERRLELSIAINASAINLQSLDFPDRAHATVRSAGIDPHEFCIEVTESAASSEIAHGMEVLSRLRLKGFELSIDDFGTGFSSLQRLHKLPFSSLKIDRSFVTDLATSRDSQTIVRSVIDLARNLGLSTVAEGVEDQATEALLEQLGADAVQGYLIARPMTAQALPDWLFKWNPRPVVERQANLKLIKS